MSTLIRYYSELKAYRLAFGLQQEIYRLSRTWPADEVHSLTARALGAARAVGAGLSHAWARRGEPAEFVTKLTEVDAELAETLHWLETAHSCGYLADPDYRKLRADGASLGRMLSMMARAEQKLPEPEPPRGASVQDLIGRLS
jgi:four helix bundle protein